ncbi:hypothetical protein FB446DRAFT_446613 [Lentinula raphanica]|nr:hypothetical protein FB446DRAFT_446613 [Lentinula raphanica]
MSQVWIEVEHGFGVVVNSFPSLNIFWKMQIYTSPIGDVTIRSVFYLLMHLTAFDWITHHRNSIALHL